MGQHWNKADVFEKRLMWGTIGFVALSVMGLLLYANARGAFVKHLITIGFNDPTLANQMASFSVKEVGLYVVFCFLSVAAILAVQSGWFAGPRAKWAGALLGLILVVDLARANTPWIRYYNYKERYASNAFLDVLRDKPYLHRATMIPVRFGNQMAPWMRVQVNIPQVGRPYPAANLLGQLSQIYNVEWLQHHFQFYNIQSLDVAQEPRLPADKEAYLQTVGGNILRYWQLTNTRYILALEADFPAQVNAMLAPGQNPLHTRVAFSMEPGEEGRIKVLTNGITPYALLEYTNALPRAGLYTQWQVNTNDQETLATLANPAFDPTRAVIVDEPINPPPSSASTTPVQAAEITSYSPRRIEIKANATQPSILLRNDRYHPAWKVEVDG